MIWYMNVDMLLKSHWVLVSLEDSYKFSNPPSRLLDLILCDWSLLCKKCSFPLCASWGVFHLSCEVFLDGSFRKRLFCKFWVPCCQCWFWYPSSSKTTKWVNSVNWVHWEHENKHDWVTWCENYSLDTAAYAFCLLDWLVQEEFSW